MSAYLMLWGIFTAVMFIGTFRLSCALRIVFGTLTILFLAARLRRLLRRWPRFQTLHRL